MLRTLLTSAAFLASAQASCECGYKTNTGEVWQYSLVTDFSQLTTAEWANSSDWTISDITRDATVDLEYTPENVALADGKLQLTCSAYSNSSSGGTIRSGQIRTVRSDLKYGSFRATYTVDSRSPGSVAGFFFYANDTQEIDIEIQSKMGNQTIHLGNQPTQNNNIYLPNDGVVTGEHDYRFDWLKNETKFYLDSVSAGGFTEDVPLVNGTISFNMWGNGGSFSGPATPTTDNIMSIASISLYFNTSSSSKSAKWTKACKKAGKSAVCTVDSAGLAVNNTAAKSRAENLSHKKHPGGFGKLKNILPVGVGAVLYHI
jgi:hypothetical protein